MPNTPEATEPLLPTSLVLSYITPVNTPTRVRIIAWRALLVVAILELIVAAVSGVPMAQAVYETINDMSRWGASISDMIRTLLIDDIQDWILRFLIAFCLGIPGLTQLFCLVGVRKGRSTPAILAMICVYPAIALLSIATAAAGGVILDATFGFYRPRTGPMAYFLLIPMPVAVFCILLMKDLCSLLFWISRHPLEEKAPVPFIKRGALP